LAAVGGGLFWFLKTSDSQPIKPAELSRAAKIDEAARTKYHEEQQLKAEAAVKAAAEQAAKEAAEKAAKQSTSGGGKVVYYSFATKGNPTSDFAEFKRLAAETLNDSRGWVRAGVSFQEVTSNSSFTLWLAEPNSVPSFSPSICSNQWSCSIGRNVIINDARWAGASDSWNTAGGSLRDYRHMVVNHEVGHFLGHRDNQPVCAGTGQLAPLMQQQSMNLRGCQFNPWPLAAELWTNR
jgi:hypothetical protein